MNNVYNDTDYIDVVSKLKTQLKAMKDKIGDEDTKYPEMMKLNQRLY